MAGVPLPVVVSNEGVAAPGRVFTMEIMLLMLSLFFSPRRHINIYSGSLESETDESSSFLFLESLK